ncbi:MAG: hypothetical protein MHPSP_001910, partial [Paramarteilia canceri]
MKNTVDNRFEIIEKIGQGGYSNVYRVKYIKNVHKSFNQSFILKLNMNIGDEYAMKIEKASLSNQRLKSEAAILQKLS